jgi:prepilin signal peptidase PulO-like enzyme (type II secretory pathway)
MTAALWSVSLVVGLAAGVGSFALFLSIPESWIREDEPDEEPVAPLPKPRLRLLPFGLLWILTCVALSAQAFSSWGNSWIAALCVLSLVPLSIVFVSDCMTRIIPDQAVVALAVLGVLFWALGLIPSLHGALPGMFSATAPWYLEALNRIGAALAGGLLLLVVGWIGSRMAGGAEAMGMGDVKLLAAIGLLTGIWGLLAVLLVAFVTGAVYAVPALMRKYRRRPVDTEEAGDLPDGTMPFGPFLVVGGLSVLFFSDQLQAVASWYLSVF